MKSKVYCLQYRKTIQKNLICSILILNLQGNNIRILKKLKFNNNNNQILIKCKIRIIIILKNFLLQKYKVFFKAL